MIREPTEDDVPAMVELGRMMHAESPVFSRLTFDAERLSVTIRNVMLSPAGFARVSGGDEITGAMLAMAVPHWCSSDLVACDLALFVHPEFRGGTAAARMLMAYRDWAAGLGAKITNFGIMTGVQVDRTQTLCERLGWVRSGVVMEAA